MAPPEMFYRSGQMGPLKSWGGTPKSKAISEFQGLYYAVVVYKLVENSSGLGKGDGI